MIGLLQDMRPASCMPVGDNITGSVVSLTSARAVVDADTSPLGSVVSPKTS